jgi:hypothetical protein
VQAPLVKHAGAQKGLAQDAKAERRIVVAYRLNYCWRCYTDHVVCQAAEEGNEQCRRLAYASCDECGSSDKPVQ